MAEGFSAEVVGIDMNPRMVEEARSRSERRTGVTFQVADAENYQFTSSAFDAAWIKRTLIHIANPGMALDEMVRVVKPGGRIVAVEPDLEYVLLDAGLVDVTRKVLALHATSYANPWAGRQLHRLMIELGLVDVQVRVDPVQIAGLAATDAALRLLSFAKSALADGVLSPADAVAWEEDLRVKDNEGRFGCYAIMFTAHGHVPALGVAKAELTTQGR